MKRILITGFSLVALSIAACSPPIEEEATTETSTPETTEPITSVEEPTAIAPEPNVAAPESTENVTTPHSPEEAISQAKNFYLGQYYNDEWDITIAEGPAGYSYYGCSIGEEQNCITLTDGEQTCGGDVCIFSWQLGDVVYEAEISEMNKQVFVRQGDTVIADTGSLGAFYPSGDDIPADREEVTGISEEQLQTVADQIYRAVYAEDWGAIAKLSTETVRLNYPDEELSSEIGRKDISAALNNSDLEEWKARIMTSRLDDLLLNQYGAMFGGGGLWVSEIVGEPEPKIYSINIW